MKKENIFSAINEICRKGYENMWKQIDEQSTTINKQAKQIERLQKQLNDAVVILRRFERVTPFVIGGKYLQADLERFYKKWGVK